MIIQRMPQRSCQSCLMKRSNEGLDFKHRNIYCCIFSLLVMASSMWIPTIGLCSGGMKSGLCILNISSVGHYQGWKMYTKLMALIQNLLGKLLRWNIESKVMQEIFDQPMFHTSMIRSWETKINGMISMISWGQLCGTWQTFRHMDFQMQISIGWLAANTTPKIASREGCSFSSFTNIYDKGYRAKMVVWRLGKPEIYSLG